MKEADDIQYFNGEKNPAFNIKTLDELAERGQLKVTTDSRMKKMVMKKASFKNQVVVLRSMRMDHQHRKGTTATLFVVVYVLLDWNAGGSG